MTFAAVITTYNRPVELGVMLRAVSEQTRPPDVVVVVDNGSSSGVRRVVTEAGARYVDAGTNSGPAGGFSLGVDLLLESLTDSDWILMLDDDDPPSAPTVFANLVDFARAQAETDPHTAAVGIRGARWDAARCQTHRIPDHLLSGPVSVDVIGNNQLPLYRAGALARAGAFDRSLFWGFEELDLGLRLRAAGYRMYVDGDAWRNARQHGHRLGMSEVEARRSVRESRATSAWRTYYVARNRVVVSMRYGSRSGAVLAAIRAGIGGALRARPSASSAAETALPLRGMLDGVRGRMGRVVDP